MREIHDLSITILYTYRLFVVTIAEAKLPHPHRYLAIVCNFSNLQRLLRMRRLRGISLTLTSIVNISFFPESTKLTVAPLVVFRYPMESEG